jgi:PAS domain S-box-containing protein
MLKQVKAQLRRQFQSFFKVSYEIRVRITVGILFVLILAATLNSVRFFNDSRHLLKSSLRDVSAEDLKSIAEYLRVEPMQKARTSRFHTLLSEAHLERAWVVETDALRADSGVFSDYVSYNILARLREGFHGQKAIAGDFTEGLPVTVSEIFRNGTGYARNLYYQFESADGANLTLAALINADNEAHLNRFSLLSILFQVLSLFGVAVISAMLLKITFAPYRQIKSDAIAAHIAEPRDPEAVDFAVETFQQVIAELKQKEQRLQSLYALQIEKAASLEIYNEYILASMPSGVVSCDIEGRITHFNRAAARILRLSREDILGNRYASTFTDLPVLVNLFDSALQMEEERTLQEEAFTFSNGHEVSLKLICRLLHDNRDEIKGAMILINDLTQLRHLEKQVNLKQQMASLGEMSAGLAHQLRNSLAAMVGFARLLEKVSAADANSGEIVNDILREAEWTEKMLEQFLGYASPSEIKRRRVGVAIIAEHLEERFEQNLRQKEIDLAIKVADGLSMLYCDPLLLGNAVINLIQNSCDACHAGDRINVEFGYASEEEVVTVTVRDTGPGISPEELPRIFNPFYTHGKATGTGLGLSLCRKWVSAHRGEITCTSEPGQGAVFTITLPNQQSESVADRESRSQRESAVAKS